MPKKVVGLYDFLLNVLLVDRFIDGLAGWPAGKQAWWLGRWLASFLIVWLYG